jgi:hypothetical protein
MAVKRYNGTSWDTVAGLGAQGAAAQSSSITTWVKTAAGGETSLSGNSDSSTTLAYTPGQEQLFINGVLQVRGSDYTATNGTSITGISALIAGDVATVTTVNAFSVTGAVPLSTVTANGDLIVGTSSGAVGRLGVGSTGQVLSVSGGSPTWATPASGGKTVIASGSLSGSEVSITSIPGTYTALELVVTNYLASNDGNNLQLRFNNDSNANRHSSFNVGLAATTDDRSRTFNGTNCVIGASQDSAVAQGMSNVIIPNYANTTSWKMGFAYYMTNNSTTSTNMNSGFYHLAYNQTGAITSLQLRFDSGTATGNYILYGVN